MPKYTSEFKLEVVKYYNEQHCGYQCTASKFNIPSQTTVKKWVKKYNEHGEKGLLKNFKSSYSGEFKQNVIEYMHKNHLSAQEWERIYYEEGPQALYKERRGRSKNMGSKPRKKKLSKEVEEDLIEEVQRLRMENAYLKKLQALIQKRTKPKQERK